eukprot:RCo030972
MASTVEAVLAQFRLSEYASRFLQHGVTDLAGLRGMSEAQCRQLLPQIGPRARLRQAIASLPPTDAPPAAVALPGGAGVPGIDKWSTASTITSEEVHTPRARSMPSSAADSTAEVAGSPSPAAPASPPPGTALQYSRVAAGEDAAGQHNRFSYSPGSDRQKIVPESPRAVEDSPGHTTVSERDTPRKGRRLSWVAMTPSPETSPRVEDWAASPCPLFLSPTSWSQQPPPPPPAPQSLAALQQLPPQPQPPLYLPQAAGLTPSLLQQQLALGGGIAFPSLGTSGYEIPYQQALALQYQQHPLALPWLAAAAASAAAAAPSPSHLAPLQLLPTQGLPAVPSLSAHTPPAWPSSETAEDTPGVGVGVQEGADGQSPAAVAVGEGMRIYVLGQFKMGRRVQFEAPFMLSPGDYFICEGDKGMDLGACLEAWVGALAEPPLVDNTLGANRGGQAGSEIDPATGAPLYPKVLRVATPQEVHARNTVQGPAEAACVEKARKRVWELGLEMKIVDAEYQFDRRKLTFYYESNERLDFRRLVRDLYRMFRTRIWMSKIH